MLLPFLLTHIQESSEEGDDTTVKPGPSKANGIKPATKPKADSGSEEDSEEESEGEDESSEESEEGSDDESDESSEAPKKVASSKINGAKSTKKADDKEESEESSEEGESSSDEEESSEVDSSEEPKKSEEKPKATAPVPQKRKDAPASYATETPAKKAKSTSDSQSTSIFVGNLSWNIDQDWLASIFESVGGVVGARIITDRDSGRPKGFGYVDFETPEQAQKALELKDTEVDGRRINVDLAQSRPAGESPRQDRAAKYGDKILDPTSTLFVGNLSFNSTQDSLYDLFGQAGGIVSVRVPTDKESGQVKGYKSLAQYV